MVKNFTSSSWQKINASIIETENKYLENGQIHVVKNLSTINGTIIDSVRYNYPNNETLASILRSIDQKIDAIPIETEENVFENNRQKRQLPYQKNITEIDKAKFRRMKAEKFITEIFTAISTTEFPPSMNRLLFPPT